MAVGESARGSIRDSASCQVGAGLLADGSPVATYVRGVCAVWVDGGNASAIETAYRIKGSKRGRRPFGVVLSAERLGEMIDPNRISPETRSLFLDSAQLSARLGSLSFVRYPVQEAVARVLPDAALSRDAQGSPWLQSWLPEGCETTRVWMQQINAHDVELPIVTSMNVSGDPEVVDQDEGADFCEQHGIPLFLGDPESVKAVSGSFPIVQVDGSGISVARAGHFPSSLFDILLDEWGVDQTDVKPASYPVVETHDRESVAAIPPDELRRQLIERLDGSYIGC